MVEGLEDDEEEEFLKANPDLVPLYFADILGCPREGTWAAQKKVFEVEDSLDAVLQQEWEFEAQMSKVTRVREDDLETVFLEKESGTKSILVSLRLEEDFCQDLLDLLKEFQDVFAWEYFDMKGLNLKFYQHKIHLKPDAVPIKQHRYRMNPHMAK